MSQKEKISKLEGMCQECKEVLNQAFMDKIIFGTSCILMDAKGNIRRIHPRSEEFTKLTQQKDENI